MSVRCCWVAGCLLLQAAAAPAAAPDGPAKVPPDPRDLAARIDGHLAVRWAAVKAEPAPPAEDAEFRPTSPTG
jgi:hypothetical protein